MSQTYWEGKPRLEFIKPSKIRTEPGRWVSRGADQKASGQIVYVTGVFVYVYLFVCLFVCQAFKVRTEPGRFQGNRYQKASYSFPFSFSDLFNCAM
jgi:hypothetical protein